MPSPIVHLAAGAAVAHSIVHKTTDSQNNMAIWTIAIFFSVAPDLDIIPGLLAGQIGAYHNLATHSLFSGMLLCIVAAPFVRRFLKGWTLGNVLLLLWACYGLHLVLDLMTMGPGLLLLWPLSDDRFSFPIKLFYGVRHSEGLFSFHHVVTFVSELTLVAVFYMLARLVFLLRCRVFRPKKFK